MNPRATAATSSAMSSCAATRSAACRQDDWGWRCCSTAVWSRGRGRGRARPQRCWPGAPSWHPPAGDEIVDVLATMALACLAA